jgi:hypothetical protein
LNPDVFNREFVDKAVFDQIQLRGRTWSFYGQLVLESIMEATSLDPQFLAYLVRKVENPNNGMGITDSVQNKDISVQVRREVKNNQKKFEKKLD